MAKHENAEMISVRRQLIITVGTVALLVVGGIILGMNRSKTPSESSDMVQADIDPGAGVYEVPGPEDLGGAAAGIAIPGYPSIGIPANTTDVQVALLNPEGNPCYFTFELVLKDSGESLYKSRQVPPGKAVTDITLSRALEPGEYEAIIQITTASLEDLSPMNGANVETVLIVK